MKQPNMITPSTTTMVDSLSSLKDGQLALPSSAIVSL